MSGAQGLREWQAAAQALSRAFSAVQVLYTESPSDDLSGQDALLRVQDVLIGLMRENDAQLRGLLEQRSEDLRGFVRPTDR